MGVWGTALSSNDTYSDIYGDFFKLYNDGLDVMEISNKLITENQELISDTDDCNNFWFALAKAQWECKQLDPELFNRVKALIETEADLQVWRQLQADEKEIKKRTIVLNKFLADLQTERTKAKSRKKKVIKEPVFEKGDCVTFRLESGNYGGAIVLEAIKETELGLNLVVTTRINQKGKPTISDFRGSEVLIKNFSSWNNVQEIGWYYPIKLKRDKTNFEIVGRLDIELNYDPHDYSKGYYYGGSIDSAKQIVELQLEFERTNRMPQINIKTESFIKS